MARLIMISLFSMPARLFSLKPHFEDVLTENGFLESYPGDGGFKRKMADVTGFIGMPKIDKN